MDRSRRDAEFDQFVAARSTSLRRTAFLIVRDWHAAEDVVQSVLVRLFVRWHRVRQDSVDAYARRAVVNASISYTRRHRRESPTDVTADIAQPEQSGVSQPVLTALGQLPPVQRAVVALRYLDDMSVAEVAGVLNVSESTVKTHTSRAMTTLRRSIPDLITTLGNDQ